ncbi:LysM peptidoglycan-binding domain-containing protein [Streptomyces montanus]|uniref:LysM peptidoglycan-binding domain-containing protein n=1 Tax=Streptomyces montanus TaxID=2580423 RepID=A0A5R9G0Z1_9ACTN|nr:M23 family metallopeptidase [Streptomyces montanus]TLS47966.1 LysM peptidoglycan-binding domain-containing protein [Streptomyces montanus]
MPAKGKHRRPKSQRLTRSIAVAGTGGAALVLPLLGATGAHATTPQTAPVSVSKKAESVSEKAAKSAPVAAQKKAANRTYTVKKGDSLFKIAKAQHVSGGWKKLYADNRRAIGDDPALIHPGLKLAIGKKAASASGPVKSKAAAPSSATTTTAAKPADAPSTSSGFTLPVAGATVGTPYHLAGSMWSSGYHTGVDFVVPTGTSLKAVGAGTVVSAGWGGAYGNQVVIKLNEGHYAQYAHLSSLSVSAGQSVTEGQQIGLSGATGNVTGPHLHFEIRTTPDYGSDVDPVAFLRAHGVTV